jgi:hypothetical protein
MSTNSKSNEVSLVKQLIIGTNKHFPNPSASLTVGGVSHTVTEITGLLQSFVSLRDAVDAAKATSKAKLDAERAQAPSLRGFIATFVTFLKGTFGNSPEALGDFGIPPRKVPKPLTAEQKTAAALKRKATRAKRNTMGKNQRKAVKGSVQVTVTATPVAEQPVVAPAAPAAPVAPAAPAAPAAPTAGNTPHS